MIIKILPYWEFEHNAKNYTKILSITEPTDTTHPYLGEHHCILKMFDITKEDLSVIKEQRKYWLPEKSEVLKALEFSRTWTKNDKILIHCYAGISRSPAIGFGIMWDKYKYCGKNKVEAKVEEACCSRAIRPNKIIMNHWKEIFPDFPF